jgi:hypothetical protein
MKSPNKLIDFIYKSPKFSGVRKNTFFSLFYLNDSLFMQITGVWSKKKLFMINGTAHHDAFSPHTHTHKMFFVFTFSAGIRNGACSIVPFIDLSVIKMLNIFMFLVLLQLFMRRVFKKV